MKCEVCHKPVEHVKKRATKVKFFVSAGIIIATIFVLFDWSHLALGTSIITNLAWLWE